MDTAESLRRALKVTDELHSVVKTMKALAGVNIRQYEQAARAVAEYTTTVEMGLQVALQRLPQHALPPKHAGGRKLGAVIFGSDQGMCGPLNDQVVSHAALAMRRMAVKRVDQATIAVGVRAAAQMDNLAASPESTVQVPGAIAGITGAVEEILHHVEEWHFKRGIEMVVLFYARPVSGGWYRVRGERLLPVDREWINGLRVKRWPGHTIPMFTMDETELFQALIREYLFASLYRAFAESLASENASRLASMQVAETNIEDRLRALTAESRQFRQTSITSELLDIIAAYEALRGKGKRITG
ncbi:MAG TPA: F0F1 ATP synthase subunit gamma [Bryobacteraceae bacterium]|jgi:F-type H+-transporting ATPase subunit gamma|nr:F0F1 ATP synthase subunit gamma [Bryobacteraceae bacterium]